MVQRAPPTPSNHCPTVSPRGAHLHPVTLSRKAHTAPKANTDASNSAELCLLHTPGNLQSSRVHLLEVLGYHHYAYMLVTGAVWLVIGAVWPPPI